MDDDLDLDTDLDDDLQLESELEGEIDELDIKNKQNELSVEKETSASNLYEKGYNLTLSGNYTEAINNYDMALKQNPSFAEVYFGKGICYHKLGDYEQAINNMSKAAKLGNIDAQQYMKKKEEELKGEVLYKTTKLTDKKSLLLKLITFIIGFILFGVGGYALYELFLKAG